MKVKVALFFIIIIYYYVTMRMLDIIPPLFFSFDIICHRCMIENDVMWRYDCLHLHFILSD